METQVKEMGPKLGELLVQKVDVWAAPLQDRPGGLAEKLEALRRAGADLAFVVARRSPEEPGAGVVFVTPLRGDREVAAAADAGFNVTRSILCVRVEGPDRPGIAAELTRRIAEEGISISGFSAAVIGPRFALYVRLDTVADQERVVELLHGS